MELMLSVAAVFLCRAFDTGRPGVRALP